jgi:hypothetical protein
VGVRWFWDLTCDFWVVFEGKSFKPNIRKEISYEDLERKEQKQIPTG